MGKTESINDRRVDVYLDTIEQKQRWTELAEKEDESLSKFIQKCVEYTIERGGPDFSELGQRSKRLQELEEEVRDLQKEIDQKDIVIEKLETDLKRYRLAPFGDDEYKGIRQYDQDLIDLLKTAEHLSGEELIQRLEIDQTDREVMDAIDTQLQRLESYGLVEHTPRGWRWVG